MGVRLGVVSYLNTKPLVEALENRAFNHDFELIYDVPSVCADKLHRGETDVALIPAAEIGRGTDPYFIVPQVGIISKGVVRSVFVVLNKEPKDVQTLALDNSSRTSVVLSQVILARQFGCRPKVSVLAPDLDTMLEQADAALFIGDPALELDLDRYRVLDLGELWTQMTGLPFVYACWTGRVGALDPKQVCQLIEAKELGQKDVTQVTLDYAASHALSAEFYQSYLTRNILYDLDDDALEGLRRYYIYGAEIGLIETIPDIQFYPQD
ncbi:MAG: menaquinone biosynthesis protein [Candidatus Latescibacteria bacterium]|jgi:chorismate dehydratase|nr:menaquinone biosynthesis protein [Candidatus Latescibacterota bacterium]MBT4139606.1 menaquinone biosynthesis protein [Candidatus Latescibacterota bacterium]